MQKQGSASFFDVVHNGSEILYYCCGTSGLNQCTEYIYRSVAPPKINLNIHTQFRRGSNRLCDFCGAYLKHQNRIENRPAGARLPNKRSIDEPLVCGLLQAPFSHPSQTSQAIFGQSEL